MSIITSKAEAGYIKFDGYEFRMEGQTDHMMIDMRCEGATDYILFECAAATTRYYSKALFELNVNSDAMERALIADCKDEYAPEIPDFFSETFAIDGTEPAEDTIIPLDEYLNEIRRCMFHRIESILRIRFSSMVDHSAVEALSGIDGACITIGNFEISCSTFDLDEIEDCKLHLPERFKKFVC